MSLTLTQQAFADSILKYVNNIGTISCGLFTNNHTPTDTDTTGTYTAATFTGYAVQTLIPPSSVVAANPAVASFPSITFTCTADGSLNDCYGVYIYDGVGHLIGAELFSAPIPVQYSGDSITVNVDLDMAQC